MLEDKSPDFSTRTTSPFEPPTPQTTSTDSRTPSPPLPVERQEINGIAMEVFSKGNFAGSPPSDSLGDGKKHQVVAMKLETIDYQPIADRIGGGDVKKPEGSEANAAALHERYQKENIAQSSKLSEDDWVKMKLNLQPKVERAKAALGRIHKGHEEIQAQEVSPGRFAKGKLLDDAYRIEAVHPEHVMADTLRPAHDAWQKSGSELSFSHWLEQNPAQVLTKKRVTYFEEAQRPVYQVGVNAEGKLTKPDGAPYSSEGAKSIQSGQVAIYAMGPDKGLYVGSHEKDVFHHSSFLGGGAVICAGELTSDQEGNLKSISNTSGHYKPTIENMLDLLHVLDGQGVKLDDVVLKLETAGGRAIFPSAKTFLKTEGMCVPEKFDQTVVTTTESGELTGLAFSSKMDDAKKMPQLVEWQKRGVDLSQVELRDGERVYRSALEFLETKGECLPVEYGKVSIEIDENNKLKSINLPNSVPKHNIYNLLKEFHEKNALLETSVINISDEIFGTFTLSAMDLRKNECNVQGWSFGTLNYGSSGELKEIVCDKEIDLSDQRQFLGTLKSLGLNINEVNYQGLDEDGPLASMSIAKFIEFVNKKAGTGYDP